MSRWAGAVAVTLAVLLVAVACSGDGEVASTPDAGEAVEQGPDPGTVLAEVAGVGSVRVGSTNGEAAVGVSPMTFEGELVPGMLAVGGGLHVEVAAPPGGVGGLFEVRLALPPEPPVEAIPAALHIDDAGQGHVVPGFWDVETGEIVVWTASFSNWFSGWWNPLNWVEEGARVTFGAIDWLADWAAGRTDPPACRNDGHAWLAWSVAELSTVHVCAQANDDASSGRERAELLLKSNRNGFQALVLPDVPREYVWVEDTDEPLRGALAWAAGLDGSKVVVLPGGKHMSVGYAQPASDALAALRWQRSFNLSVANLAIGLLGIGEEMSGKLAVFLALKSCYEDITGVSVAGADFVFSGEGAEALDGTLRCVIGVLADEALATSTFMTLIDSSPFSAQDKRVLKSRSAVGAARLQPLASKVAKAVALASFATAVWDAVFDAAGDGLLELSFQGSGATSGALTLEALRSAPVPSLCGHPAGTLVNSSLPGIADGFGEVTLLEQLHGGGPGVVFGDLTGDGVDEAAAVLGCSQGGVSWPNSIQLYGSGPVLLGGVDLDVGGVEDANGRASVVELLIESGEVRSKWLTSREGDVGCCPSLDAVVRARLDGGRVVVVEALALDESAMLEEFFTAVGRGDRAAASALAPAHVVDQYVDAVASGGPPTLFGCVGELGLPSGSRFSRGCNIIVGDWDMSLGLRHFGFGEWVIDDFLAAD